MEPGPLHSECGVLASGLPGSPGADVEGENVCVDVAACPIVQ